MRWPRWRKPEPPDDDRDFLRAIGWIDDDGQPIPSPERAKPETPRARRPWDAVPLHELIGPLLADATETIPNPNAKETTMTSPFAGITPSSTIDELARAIHGTGYTAHISTEGTTPSGRPRTIHLDTEGTVVDAHVIDPDDPQQLDEAAALIGELLDHHAGSVTEMHHLGGARMILNSRARRIRADALTAERDTRDRERVEKIVLRQWETAARTTVDAALASLGEVVGVNLDNPDREYDVAGFWAPLTDEQKAEALAPALELYRAGRDDQENEHTEVRLGHTEPNDQASDHA